MNTVDVPRCPLCGDTTPEPAQACRRCKQAEEAAKDALSRRLILEWLQPYEKAWTAPGGPA